MFSAEFSKVPQRIRYLTVRFTQFSFNHPKIGLRYVSSAYFGRHKNTYIEIHLTSLEKPWIMPWKSPHSF